MKKRIEQLVNGIFEYEQRRLLVAPDSLTFHCAPEKTVRGTVRIEAEKGGRIHGFLYCADPRMLLEPVEFQGVSNEIRYQFDAGGLTAGVRKSGTVTVCSDCGEYILPYSVEVEDAGKQETPLPFEDLAGFAKLAQEDSRKAYRCFLLPEFRKILLKPHLLALYEGLGADGFSYQSMEEFLIGAGQKEPVVFSLEERPWEFDGLTEPEKETLTLRKNIWGFQTVEVKADARFVRPERSLFTTDEFAGSTCDVGLILDTNLMHPGKNYARVTVRAGRQLMSVEITARKAGSGPEKDHRQQKEMLRRLERLYVKFRLQKLEKGSWIAQSTDAALAYRRAGGQDPFVDLFLVQLSYADGKKQKAKKQLELLEAQKSRLNTLERQAFYLYITTFFYPEASYVDRVEEEVNRMFCQDKTSWRLQWILLYLQERYLHDGDVRYEAVAEQFGYGCRSPILYLEAWQAVQSNPFLLRHLGEFELSLLRFAARAGVLTPEALLQTASLVTRDTAFDRRLYEVLTSGYEKSPSDELLRAICRLLIRGGKDKAEYFAWYEKGVARGLKLTGLYEAYMASMDCTDFSALPQIIRMYFTYDTSLNYRKRAAIYSGIVRNRKRDPQIYYSQRAAMEKFALEQLEQDHVTEDLLLLYREFLKESLLTRPLAERLVRLLFSYEAVCSLPGVRRLVVHSSCCREEQTAAADTQGRALVRLYDPDSVILAVDGQGQRFQTEDCCEKKRLLEDDRMLAWCARKAPEYAGLVLFLCTQCVEARLMNQRLLPYFRTGSAIRQFAPAFLSKVRGMLLDYYLAHPGDDSLPDFLDGISLEEYVQVDKTALIALLAEEGRCRDAFSLLNRYGAEDIPLIRLVRICSRMVLELEFEENTMLLALCLQCFQSGKYDDKLLRYLLLYYEGPVESMKQVWRAACAFDLDTMLLEEKIIMMILFTRSGTEDSEAVFEAYLKKMGRRRLCRAYVNLKAYEYFVRGLPVAEPVFRYIGQEYGRLSEKGDLSEQEEVCRLALLQYYAREPQLSEPQRACVSGLLEEFGAKGMRFGFWKQFDRELTAPYELEGRVFAEYVGNPQSVVTIRYRYRGREEREVCEPVPNCFEGIFVREFTLFEGEELECRFEEETEGRRKCSEPWILRADTADVSENGRYSLLNQILKAVQAGEEEKANAAISSYYTLGYLAEKVFAS